MNNYKKIILFLLALFCAALHAQEPAQPDTTSMQQAISSLKATIGDTMKDHFTTIEGLAKEPALVEAIQNEDMKELDYLADSYLKKLNGSVKVRLYIKGKEQTDVNDSPACGFACIAIVRNAYHEDPPAEALLFRSPDANLTLARKIQNEAGEAIGAIVAHYPFLQLEQIFKGPGATSLYAELRQTVDGPPVTLLTHGELASKVGPAQKIVRIPNTRWLIAMWPATGVSAVVDEYMHVELPWMYIILAVVILIVGIIVLVVYHRKYRAKEKSKKQTGKYTEALSAEAISYDDEFDDESPTLILGGGAQEVDVSRYLKDTDVTNIKKRP